MRVAPNVLFPVPAVMEDSVCIRHWDWSETSQTVTLFTRGMGVVRGLAKGSKRPRTNYSGGIELLTRGTAGILVRRNSELALITEWDLSRTYRILRESLAAYRAGLYFADLTQQFVRDHDPHPALFDALVASLDELGSGGPMWSAVASFQWSVLVEAGYRPVLDRDARTGEPLEADDAVLGFDAESGGLIADPGPHGAQLHAVWRLRSATADYLRSLDTPAPDDSTPENSGDADDSAPHRAARLLGTYIRHILGAEPPTHAELFQAPANAE